jgi:hypothetical protein
MNITKRPAIGERILRRALIAFVVFSWLIGQEKAAAIDYLWNNRLSTYVYCDGVLGRNNYDNNAVSGGFRIGF